MVTQQIIKYVLVLCISYFVCINHTYAQKDKSYIWDKKELRILDIGNSYTEDVVSYLPLLVKKANIDTSNICLYKLICGGSSLQTWLNIYHGLTTKNYAFRKILGGLTCTYPISKQSGKEGDTTLIHDIIDKCKWDIIVIHEVSYNAPYYEKYVSIGELLNIIREQQGDILVGTYLIHSYWSNYKGNKERSSLVRWNLIASTTKRICENYGIDFIIPYGTAVENLRLSSHNTGYDLTRDGTHLGYGLGRYVASCCYFESIFKKRYKVSIIGNPLIYDIAKDIERFSPKYKNGCVAVTLQNRYIAQFAASLACKDMYSLHNPDEFGNIVQN